MYVRGARPQAPGTFSLNPPSLLVIGYHWLVFLNQEWNTRKIGTMETENCESK